MVTFIDDYRDTFGVEPICSVLPIAPSTYYEQRACQLDPDRRSDRAKRDAWLMEQIQRVWDEHFQVYGVRKIWRQLQRESIDVPRCTVERLMRRMGLKGAVRGRRRLKSNPTPIELCPADRVKRQFTADRPNQLWVADFTYVATWVGFVYTAFVIDVFANRIVGWRCSRRQTSDLVLDALEQALYARGDHDGLIHHSDRGSQYLAIGYTERLKAAGIDPSVGTTGCSYDNALAETQIGLYKTELIRRRGPWKGLDDVEYATLEWVDWFNHRRLLEPIGHVPPAEYEQAYYATLNEQAMAA
jgi:putative transposase